MKPVEASKNNFDYKIGNVSELATRFPWSRQANE